MIRITTFLLAAALAACIGAAHGAEPAPAAPDPGAGTARNAGQDAEFARARAELARAAARMAELARERAGADGLAARYQADAATRPVLGVLLAPDDGPGAYVSGVTPAGAAAQAGLRSGDHLLSINGTPIMGSSGGLRVDNARKLVGALEAGTPATIGYQRDGREHSVEVTPVARSRVMVLDGRTLAELAGDISVETLADGSLRMTADSINIDDGEITREITRTLETAGFDNCPGEGCRAPLLMSALRWSGLNLASVDPRLGRYFGTDRGVLVLSSGGLDGLEPGDVILEVDGATVADPRDVMSALRDRPEDARVAIAYLRDRSRATAEVAVPKMRSLRIPAPPAPPTPPEPPAKPANAAPQPPKPPRPPVPA